MKIKKKWTYCIFVCLVLLFVLCCGLFYKEKEKGTIILYWDTPFYVSEKTTNLLNEELQKCGYNVQIKFEYISFDSYYDTVDENITKQKVDILHSGIISWQKVGERYRFIEKLYPLDEFFLEKNGKRLYNAFPEILWESMKINYQSYFICCGGNIPIQYAALVNFDMANTYGIEVNQLTYDKILEYADLFQSKEKGKKEYFIQYPSCILSNVEGYTFVCSPFIPLLVKENGEELNVERMLEIPEFVSLYETLQSLYYSEMIAPSSMEQLDSVLFQFLNYGTENDFKAAAPNMKDVVLLEQNIVYPLELVGNCVSIAKNSKNAEIALEVLAEIYTNENITNLLVYGEKNVDYCIYEGHAISCDTLEYVVPSSTIGNLFLSLPHYYQSEEKNTEYKEILNTMKCSKITGFVFDGSDVVSEIEAVTNIMNNFYACDNDLTIFEESLVELEEKLYHAGLEKIEREIMRQLEEWEKNQ